MIADFCTLKKHEIKYTFTIIIIIIIVNYNLYNKFTLGMNNLFWTTCQHFTIKVLTVNYRVGNMIMSNFFYFCSHIHHNMTTKIKIRDRIVLLFSILFLVGN